MEESVRKQHGKITILILSVLCILFTFSEAESQTLDEALLKNINYREIGPTRQSGRFVDFAVVEQEPTTFYAATGSGHLWKTVNNGITFEPLFENEKIFSIGDVAVAPSDPNIVWVGSGEANNSRSTYWGDGMYKSTDAGKTWKNMGLKESHESRTRFVPDDRRWNNMEKDTGSRRSGQAHRRCGLGDGPGQSRYLVCGGL